MITIDHITIEPGGRALIPTELYTQFLRVMKYKLDLVVVLH